MTTPTKTLKPLGRKSYGSIAHLPGSRLGPGDHHCNPGQARIATEQARDRHDVVIVQEKLDGSNVGVAKVNGQILALNRAGYLADTSPYPQHHLFARCYEIGKPFALLVLVETIGSGAAQELFHRHGVEILLLNRRVSFKMPNKGWDGKGAQFPVCWLCWQLLPQPIMYGTIPLGAHRSWVATQECAA